MRMNAKELKTREAMAQENLQGLRSLYLQRDLESWNRWEEELRMHLRSIGKTLEDFNSSEEEINQLKNRVKTLRAIRINRDSIAPSQIAEIIDLGLKSVGTNFEELWSLMESSQKSLSGAGRFVFFLWLQRFGKTLLEESQR